MKAIPATVRRKARNIRLLLLDVDGVLTDGGIVLDDRGRELKRFDVQDGHGIKLLMTAGIQVALITGRFSRAVQFRAKELGITMVYQGVQDKGALYRRIKKSTGRRDTEIAFVGDDIVDLPILQKVGLSVAVRNCWEELKHRADYVTRGVGGHGAVREVAEMLLKAQGRWEKTTQNYYKS